VSSSLDSSAFAGIVLVVALTGALPVELVQGDEPHPDIPILAMGGLAYVAALLRLRWRSSGTGP
jgi:hypothetical protein